MSDAVLELQGVTKTYRRSGAEEVAVLRGVDLILRRGEMVALVAPSGAGKSTLLHLSGLLDTVDGGAVLLGGRDMSRASDRQRTEARRQKIGFVYQFHHLLPEFSALENVSLPQRANGATRSEADQRSSDLLNSVGLAARIDHRPGELSGGEQQRVALARALANDPPLLLADEPTGNLDEETAAHVFAALKRQVAEAGLAALIATHNLDLAAKADRIVRLESGVIAG